MVKRDAPSVRAWSSRLILSAELSAGGGAAASAAGGWAVGDAPGTGAAGGAELASVGAVAAGAGAGFVMAAESSPTARALIVGLGE